MVLIVDDDPTFLEAAQVLLSLGPDVRFARDSEQAKMQLGNAANGFSLLMIDLDLPGQDGFSLIREVRKRFPSIPVVAVSDALKSHVIESAKVIGAAETLQKPIDKDWTAAIARVRAKYGKPSTSF